MSSHLLHAIAVRAASGGGQDRALVVPIETGMVVAVADGAGGTGAGDLAAQAVVDAVVGSPVPSPSWTDVLTALDRDPKRLGHGQTTAVVVSVLRDGLRGASVGDSAAWIVHVDGVDDLTADQQRKPLLGSGASPVSFTRGPLADSTLLVASDGLVKYATRDEIARVARGADLEDAARQLVDLVRYPSGALPDDVSVVLVRSS